MNTFQLSCFLAVAEHLNFARAAEELHVTQPAVTQQIHSLEKELGGHLVPAYHPQGQPDRGRAGLSQRRPANPGPDPPGLRQVRPTPKTSLLCPSPWGVCSTSTCCGWRPRCGGCGRSFPACTPCSRWRAGRTSSSCWRRAAWRACWASRCRPVGKSGISFQEVRRAPMVCLLPEGHPLAGRESLSLEDLSGQRLVLFDPSKPIPITTGAMSQMLGARTPAELYFAQSPEAMAALVQAGYGAGFLPDVFPPWGCGCARVPLRGMEPVSLGLYYRARQASAPLKALLRILRECDSRPKPRETMGKHRDI